MIYRTMLVHCGVSVTRVHEIGAVLKRRRSRAVEGKGKNTVSTKYKLSWKEHAEKVNIKLLELYFNVQFAQSFF